MVDLIVSVEQGKLRGKTVQNCNGATYYSFQGIPYGKPPLGDLRFKAPQPPESWTGIRDATEEGPECFANHIVYLHIVGSEDCLSLNVYTPQLPINGEYSLKPVMVWIHGGGFTSGSGKIEMYGPDFLITQDVVVVTINYRLGVLGFLSLDDPTLSVPGNAGLKDQVMALKWIQKNIHNFNGDPSNVTIFGESAGGASVHYLMLSPMGRGLFHKAIAQSGCALNSWATGRRLTRRLARYLNFESSDERDILKFLQEVPVEKLYEAQLSIKDSFRADTQRPHGPVIEKVSPYEQAFLCEDPLDIILQSKYNKVPLIMGFTSHEGILHDLIHVEGDQIITDFEQSVPYSLNLPKGSQISLLAAKRIKDFYYGNEEPSRENKGHLYRLQTDNLFFRAIHTSVKHHAVTSLSPVYLYRFSFDGEINVYKKFGNINHPGACHADELGYLFKIPVVENVDPNSPEGKTIQRMIKLWTNFAHYGNPNPPQPDDLINALWKPATKDEIHFLDIDKELTAGVNPESESMAFWDDIYSLNATTSKL